MRPEPPEMSLIALPRPGGHSLACLRREGAGPVIVWLGGFKSEMTATKATHLDGWAAREGRAFLRFDYFGHGASSGDFRAATVSRWVEDALAAIDALSAGPLVLVGSSMGAWIACHVALRRPERTKAMVLLAPAVDFTRALLVPGLPPDAMRAIEEKGEWLRPSAYGDGPYPITRALIEDGDACLLGERIAISAPVRIIHGQDDPDVPWTHGLRLVEALESRDVTFTLVKGGDHRLSKPADLARLEAAVAGLADAP